MKTKMQKVKAVKDESGHWYVIPEQLFPLFYNNLEDEFMVDSGEFDNNWRKYRTGGDLNLVQLWADV